MAAGNSTHSDEPLARLLTRENGVSMAKYTILELEKRVEEMNKRGLVLSCQYGMDEEEK